MRRQSRSNVQDKKPILSDTVKVDVQYRVRVEIHDFCVLISELSGLQLPATGL